MKLFKCYAVLPLVGRARTHVVRIYVTSADTSAQARARIREEEPSALLVTTPVETPAPVLAATASLDERELADLRSAYAWYERQARDLLARPLSGGPDPTR